MLPQISNSLALINRAIPINWAHPLNRGRVAWWLNAPGYFGGSVWRDLTGRNRGTLTNMSGAAYASNGFRGSSWPGGYGSMLFDGISGFVDILNWTAVNFQDNVPWTIAYSVATSSSLTITPLATWNFGATAGLVARISGISPGKPEFLLENAAGNAGRWVSGGASVNDGAFHRVLCTYSGSSAASGMKMYGDGNPVTTTIVQDSSPGTLINSEMTIGAGLNVPTQPFSGKMDNISIWSRTLSASEVLADYNLSRQGYPGVLQRWGWEYGASARVGSLLLRRRRQFALN